MKRPTAFLEGIVRQLADARHLHISRLPNYPTLPPLFEPSRPPAKRFQRRKSKISTRGQTNFSQTVALVLLLGSIPVFAAVHKIDSIGLTVGDLNHELAFYTNTLPFELVSVCDLSGEAEDSLLNLTHAKVRVAKLKLGDESLVLTQHLIEKGRPIPADSRSFDHWFQHIAIVVSDMDKACDRLRTHKVKHVSTAPQTLPDWNTNAAGIKAFYFQDPEGHVLEIIWFPKGKGDPKWQMNSEKLFLGIDHTAIVVSDTDNSLALYKDLLGLRVAGESENYGVEQEHLNQVFGARVRITAFRAEHGPGIEFLEYISPPGGRVLSEDSKPNDLVFWRTSMLVDQLDGLTSILPRTGAKIISAPDSPLRFHEVILRDPDGHALELQVNRSETAISSRR
jgi:catechol 2,3-dioxygenase-like lactoylglutathione lyase family enzyme